MFFFNDFFAFANKSNVKKYSEIFNFFVVYFQQFQNQLNYAQYLIISNNIYKKNNIYWDKHNVKLYSIAVDLDDMK